MIGSGLKAARQVLYDEIMPSLKELIVDRETASGEARGKVESHVPRIEVLDAVEAGKPFRVRVAVGPHPMTPGAPHR